MNTLFPFQPGDESVQITTSITQHHNLDQNNPYTVSSSKWSKSQLYRFLLLGQLIRIQDHPSQILSSKLKSDMIKTVISWNWVHFHFHSSDFLRVLFVKLSALMCFMSEVSDSEVDELFMSFWPCYQVLNFYINLYNLYTRKSHTL